jgi:hypothetical protein
MQCTRHRVHFSCDSSVPFYCCCPCLCYYYTCSDLFCTCYVMSLILASYLDYSTVYILSGVLPVLYKLMKYFEANLHIITHY